MVVNQKWANIGENEWELYNRIFKKNGWDIYIENNTVKSKGLGG